MSVRSESSFRIYVFGVLFSFGAPSQHCFHFCYLGARSAHAFKYQNTAILTANELLRTYLNKSELLPRWFGFSPLSLVRACSPDAMTLKSSNIWCACAIHVNFQASGIQLSMHLSSVFASTRFTDQQPINYALRTLTFFINPADERYDGEWWGCAKNTRRDAQL